MIHSLSLQCNKMKEFSVLITLLISVDGIVVKTEVILHTIDFNEEFLKKKNNNQRNSKLSRKEITIIYICIPTDFGWERVNFLYTSSHVYVF